MATLRPSETHRNQDWDALGERLDTLLPQQPKNRRRGFVLPLLLGVALLSSNAVWWHSSQKDQKRLTQLEMQTALLQKNFRETSNPVVSYKPMHQRDTVWRTVYVTQRQVPDIIEVVRNSVYEKAKNQTESPTPAPVSVPELKTIVVDASDNNQQEAANILPLASEMPKDTMLAKELQVAVYNKGPENLTHPLLEEKKTTKPFVQKVRNNLRPKYFKIGLQTAWIHLVSKSLMHQGGYSFGTKAEIGFTRHWALDVGHSMSRFHYKAHETAAILGAPNLPMPPTNEHHYAEMDVTRQRSHQWDVGLRYTFSQPSRPQPYLGIGWAFQTLMPFTVEYEIQHLPTGVFEKGIYQITSKKRLNNYFVLNTGLDIPMSKRLNLTLEGFYQRQWKKPSTVTPDLLGLRFGAHWLF